MVSGALASVGTRPVNVKLTGVFAVGTPKLGEVVAYSMAPWQVSGTRSWFKSVAPAATSKGS